MSHAHPTHSTPDPLARGQVPNADAAPIRTREENVSGTIPLLHEPAAAPAAAEGPARTERPRRRKKAHPPGQRSREQQRRSLAARWWLAGGSAAAAVLILAVAAGVTWLLRTRPAAAPTPQAAAPAAQAAVVPPPAQAPVKPSPSAPAAQPPKAPTPVPPPSAPAAAPPAPVRADTPLNDEEKRWQPAFRVQLAKHGRALCASDLFPGKKLVGVLLDLEVRGNAPTRVPLGAATVTVLDKEGKRNHAAAVFFPGRSRPQTAHLPGGASVTTFPGDVHVGGERFQFDAGPGPGGLGNVLVLPVLVDDGPSLEYDFYPRVPYRVGLLLKEDGDPVTAVRVLGHVLELDAAHRDDTVPMLAAPAGAQVARGQPRPPADPPAAKPANPDEPDVYHYVPAVNVSSRSKNIWVRQDAANRWKVGPIGASGEVAATEEGNEITLLPDALGSTNIQVVVGARLGYTTLAGLRFRHPARVNIWGDGVVEVTQLNIRAVGEDGENYAAQRVTFPGRVAIVMVHQAPNKPVEVPKSVELTDEERSERAAAGKLKSARELLEDGKQDKARALCEEILGSYPKTKAAADARKLLDR